MGEFLVWVVWFLAAAGCIGSGVAVVSMTNPFFSALALIGNLASLAVLYLLLSAEFLAAAQVLVYAGAVMVMFLFVIAYLGGRADAPWAGGPPLLRTAAVVAAAALLVEVVVVLGLAWGDNLRDPAEVSGSFGMSIRLGSSSVGFSAALWSSHSVSSGAPGTGLPMWTSAYSGFAVR